MEFLAALRQAEKQGVSGEQFLPIWQAETQVQQHREEINMIEAKIRLAEVQTKTSGGSQESILQLFAQQREEIAQIRSEMMFYQQSVLQVIGDVSNLLTSKELPKFSSANNEITKHKVDSYNSIDDIDVKTDFNHNLDNVVNGFSTLNVQPSNLKTGVYFKVDGLTSLYESCGERLSPSYTLPNCPCTFHLSVSFSSREELVVDLVITRVGDMKGFLKWPVSIEGFGSIQDGNKSYTQLWELPSETSKVLKSAQPGDEVRIRPQICLKTQRFEYKSITLGDLTAKRFTFEDSLSLRWNVTASNKDNSTNNNNLSLPEKTARSTKHVSFSPKPATLSNAKTPDLPLKRKLGETVGGSFTVKNVSKLLLSVDELLSKAYTFPSCPCAFNLAVSFNSKKELVMQLVITQTGKYEDSHCWPFTMIGFGQIRNNAQGYSLIWELKNDSGKKMSQLKPGQEKRVFLPICLKTSKNAYDSVTFDTLQTRKYVSLEDSLSFQWSLDVQKA